MRSESRAGAHGRIIWWTAGLVGLALLTGCADDGQELRPPTPHQTTTTAAPRTAPNAAPG